MFHFMRKKFFADIILPLPFQHPFTYYVPSELQHIASRGKRAIVQFGKRKYYAGIIQKIHSIQPQGYTIKNVESIIDDKAIVNERQFQCWEWIAAYYCASLGSVMKTALPPPLRLESNTVCSFNPKFSGIEKLNEKEQKLLAYVSKEKYTTITQLRKSAGKDFSFLAFKKLLSQKAILNQENIKEKCYSKTEIFIGLSQHINDKDKEVVLSSLNKAPKQKQLMRKVLALVAPTHEKSIGKKQLLQESGASEATLRELIKKEILTIYRQPISTQVSVNSPIGSSLLLTNAQNQALYQIKEEFKEKTVVLLHGATSSGKTEVYIKLIEEVIGAGRQALYLLPEIALTDQMVQRVQRIFGNRVAVYHSKLNNTERMELWHKVLHFKNQQSNCPIILGTRSALFLPYANLGLIVVDEEHESSYKQFDPEPRYHARDTAIVLATLHQSKVILGSATPAIESYYNAMSGKYGLVKLTTRFYEIPPPEILIADIKEAFRKKQMKALFTPLLYTAIQNALEQKEQVMLFQNRRGFAPFIICMDCGAIAKCDCCDVSLTYHKNRNRLVCHYCGFYLSNHRQCHQCKSKHIQIKGFGTERIEDEISLLFPEATVARLDVDTASTKSGAQTVLEKFASGKTDILVGTQLIAKGLDFDNVSVVGIMNADTILSFPDFRSYERGFQLLTQISGRAGRRRKKGKVILQTYQPLHPVIQEVIQNNYVHMARVQLLERQLFRYPPYFRFIKIRLRHLDSDILQNAAQHLARTLGKINHAMVYGPAYPLIPKIRRYHLREVLIKISKKNTHTSVKQSILSSVSDFKQLPTFKQIVLDIDVDPM
jgi:primosomal protein N' (replication factor Y)